MWVNIDVPPSFSRRESDLFFAWTNHVGKLQSRGHPLGFLSDSVPILVALAGQHYPRSSPAILRKKVDKLVFFYIQTQRLLTESAGRA